MLTNGKQVKFNGYIKGTLELHYGKPSNLECTANIQSQSDEGMSHVTCKRTDESGWT